METNRLCFESNFARQNPKSMRSRLRKLCGSCVRGSKPWPPCAEGLGAPKRGLGLLRFGACRV